MDTIFHLNASELDEKFLLGIKTLFQSRTIEITIRDIGDSMDETEYLMSSPENARRLQASIDAVEHGKELVQFSAEEFENFVHEKSRV